MLGFVNLFCMAKVQHLSAEVIAGFHGVIDFYYWRGQPVCRAWPKVAKQPNSPTQLASREAFRACRADLRDMEESVRVLWPRDFFGHRQAWLDYYTGMYLRFVKLHGVRPPVVQRIVITAL